jgi:hypothetical protein
VEALVTLLRISIFCISGLILGLFTPGPGYSAYADSGGAESFPSVTLWPLAYHKQDNYRTRTDVVYPVFHYLREGSHERFAIRPFLFNLEKDPRRKFRQLNILWPFSHFETEDDEFLRYIFPFYYQARNERKSSFHLWPFYGRASQADGTEFRSTLYPFFQYRQNIAEGGKQLDYLWPLGRIASTPETSTNYLLPFWWTKKEPGISGRFIFPYFMYETATSRHDAIFPLWYRLRAATEKIDLLVPFWYSRVEEDSRFRTFFPLYWDYAQGQDKKLSLFIPLYGRYRNQTDDFRILLPFYFQHTNLDLKSELRYYFPLYGYYRKGETVRHSYYAFPFYAHIRDETVDREAWYFLWPLIYRDKRPDSSETWAIPLFWMKKTPVKESRLALIPPYYYMTDDEGRKEVHYWPFYGLSQDRNYRERSILWPLFRLGSNPAGDHRSWQFLTLYRKIEPQRHMLGFFPLWHYDRKAERVHNISLLHWHEKSKHSEQFSLLHLANPDWSLFSTKRTKTERHNHLFPFYSYTTDTTTKHKNLCVLGPLYSYRKKGPEVIRHNFLWKFLYAEKNADKTEKGFLWRLIRKKQDSQGRLFEFNPFYYSERRSNDEEFTSWLGGIYSVKRDATGEKYSLFWFIKW